MNNPNTTKGLFSPRKWPKKLAAIALFLIGSGMIAFASFYFIAPQIADHRAQAIAERLKKLDEANLIPGQVNTSSGIDVYPSTAAGTIPMGDKLTFRYVNWNDVPAATDELGVRIVIPDIHLDQEMVELNVYTNNDGVLEYETPKFSVGHLFDRDNIGSNKDVFLWGHINSPWKNEGSAFENLSEAADHASQGQAVDVYVYTEKHVYVYRIVNADFHVPPDNMGLGQNSGEPTVKLVSCWPPYNYRERLVVTTKLIQVADIPADMQDSTVLKSLPSAFRSNGVLG